MRSIGMRRAGLDRLAGAALAILAVAILLAAAPAGPAAVVPVRTIDAPTQGGGAGGGLLGELGWILIVGLAIAAVALILAAIVLFRTRGSKAAPASEGWWTCGKCGAGNMDGSARCHACATWRSTTPRPTPTA